MERGGAVVNGELARDLVKRGQITGETAYLAATKKEDFEALVSPAFLFRSELGDGKPDANGTVRLSRDEGKSWPVSRVLYPGEFAYSCLASLSDGAVGCLFAELAFRNPCAANWQARL